MLIYAKIRFFAYKSQNKAPRLLIFGKHILFNNPNNNIKAKIWFHNYFLCILLFCEFLMYFFVFFTFCLCLFFRRNLSQTFFEA